MSSPPAASTPLPVGLLSLRTQQNARWAKVKGLCAILGVVAVALLLAPKGNPTGSQNANASVAQSSTSTLYASSVASVPAPSMSPATPGAPNHPSPQSSPSTGGNAVAPATDASANGGALAATMERLRAERNRAQALSQSTRPQQQNIEVSPDQAQASPPPGPVPATRVWSHVTSAGTRWRLRPQGGDYVLFVDLGYDQIASIHVAPQFQDLDLDAMNIRVDWLKAQITQAYSTRSASYQYARDGSIYPVP